MDSDKNISNPSQWDQAVPLGGHVPLWVGPSCVLGACPLPGGTPPHCDLIPHAADPQRTWAGGGAVRGSTDPKPRFPQSCPHQPATRPPAHFPGHRVARLQTALQNILGVTVIVNTLNKISIVFPKTIAIFIPYFVFHAMLLKKVSASKLSTRLSKEARFLGSLSC